MRSLRNTPPLLGARPEGLRGRAVQEGTSGETPQTAQGRARSRRSERNTGQSRAPGSPQSTAGCADSSVTAMHQGGGSKRKG